MEERMHMAPYQNRSRERSLRVVTATETLEEDIRLAAETTVPVLISGPVAACRAIASEVDRRCASSQGAVEVLDCCADTCHAALVELVHRANTSAEGNRPRCVLLQEVHALAIDDQVLLERHLVETRHASDSPTRILASSSVALFPRVQDHLFSERLYYLLNVIHIVVPTARRIMRETR
jgi:DNA-binding NtrC family response regulator